MWIGVQIGERAFNYGNAKDDITLFISPISPMHPEDGADKKETL